jgi:hypothetical protein
MIPKQISGSCVTEQAGRRQRGGGHVAALNPPPGQAVSRSALGCTPAKPTARSSPRQNPTAESTGFIKSLMTQKSVLNGD